MAQTTATRNAAQGLDLGLYPYAWASDWGEDDAGIWVGFTFRGVRQGFRWIPPGDFTMGSPEHEPERFRNEKQHHVTLTKGFWLGETTVTQALWQAVIGGNPSGFTGEDLPVANVGWDDAVGFLDTLNGRCPELALRLPTEAEWEYACRAGTNTPFSTGAKLTTDQANYHGDFPYAGGEKGIARRKTVPVTELPANDWGLYHMHGNVWEWCADWYGAYPDEPVVDPTGPDTGVSRVLRGGSWADFARDARSAYRIHDQPSNRYDFYGFRLARGL